MSDKDQHEQDQPKKEQLEQVKAAIRERMKRIRESKNLNRNDIDAELGRSPGYYSRLESGTIELSLERLIELASVWEIPLGALVDDKKPEEPRLMEEGSQEYMLAPPTRKDLFNWKQEIIDEVWLAVRRGGNPIEHPKPDNL